MGVKMVYQRKELLAALMLCGRVVSKRAFKPILANVRLNGLCEATDLECAVTVGFNGHEAAEGPAVVLPCGRLKDVVKAATGDELDIVTEGRTSTIGAAVLLGEDPEEYPVIPGAPMGANIVSAQRLKSAIERTTFAAAKERSRFAFNGVRLQADGDGVLRLIATDRKRVAVAEVPAPEFPSSFRCGHIVPTRSLETVAYAIGKDDGEVLVTFDERSATFQGSTKAGGFWRVSTRLVDGAFPKYESVIPRDAKVTATLDRAAFLAALKQVQPFTNEEARAVTLSALNQNGLTIHAQTVDVGKCFAGALCTFDGEWADPIGFNPTFLIEGLEAFAADTVVLAISGKDTPALISAAGDTYRYVVMPVQSRNAK